MKALKIILLIVAIIAAFVFITPAITAKDYAVEKEITIELAKDTIFDYVKHLKNQDDYSKWANMDPDMKKEFTGTDGTVGFISGWDSENKDVGRGEQEIVGITEGKRIDYELRFYEPFEATDNAYILTESVDSNTTVVKWGFNGSMNYPMNIMLLFMDMETMLGDDLQEGLDNLKKVLES